MIVGVGVDLVSIARVRAATARFAERFAARILTDDEIAQWRRAACAARAAAFAAKRFAAKEAFAKALGDGMRAPAVWRHIGIANDARGRPFFRFAAPLAESLAARGVGRSHLSLSDDGGFAQAFVILESA